MPTGQIEPNEDDYQEEEKDEECTEVTTDGDCDEDGCDEEDDDGIEVIVDADEEEEGKQHTGFKIVDAGGCPPFNVA